MISSSLSRPVKMASNSRLVSATPSGWPAWARARAAGKSTEALVTFMSRLHAGTLAKSRAMVQEVVQQGMAVFGCDAFGMELHAMDGMGLVHHALDHAVLAGGGDFQRRRHAGRIDGEGVIARGQEIIVEAAEHRLAGVMHAGQLAVHRFGRAHDAAAIDLADGLMAQAHAQDRHVAGGLFDHLQADAGLVGGAGAGRQHDAFRLHRQRLGGRDLVIADHVHLRAQLAQIMEEVVGEAVIVIDQKKHGCLAAGWEVSVIAEKCFTRTRR